MFFFNIWILFWDKFVAVQNSFLMKQTFFKARDTSMLYTSEEFKLRR